MEFVGATDAATLVCAALTLLNAVLLLRILLRVRVLRIASANVPLTTNSDALSRLQRRWREIRRDFAGIDRDPYLSAKPSRAVPEPEIALLRKFLDAEGGDVERAAERLRETAAWRRDYRVVDFHKPGMARKLMMHATNPGATLYFADSGLRDSDGAPVLIGRVTLMLGGGTRRPRAPEDKMAPATHLRAGMFVVERANVIAANLGTTSSYILDTGSYPHEEMGTRDRYWNEDGVGAVGGAGVGPHLPGHAEIPDGLPTLQEALRMMTRYYPNSMKRIYVYRPSLIFRGVFAIFGAWLSADTRNKFVLVPPGRERDATGFIRPGACDAAAVPRELGGTGPSLGGDLFLRRAIDLYDNVR